MKRRILTTLTLAIVFNIQANLAQTTAQQKADLDTLYNREYRDIGATESFNAANVNSYINTKLGSNGRFIDINYVYDVDKNDIAVAYSPRKHQDRTLEMIVAYVKDKNYHNANVLAKIKLALNDNLGRTHTTVFDWTPNWFDTYIACPERYAKCLILLRDILTPSELAAHVGQLRDVLNVKYPNGTYKFTNGGANTIWAAQVSIKKGILEKNYSIVQNAYSFVTGCLDYMLIEKVHNSGEGIKVDFSYHMHGSQLYMGGYGKGFILDVLVCLKLANGTTFRNAFPPKGMDLFSRLLLEGHQYFVFHEKYDWNTSGRQITSPTLSNLELPVSVLLDAATVFPNKATEFTNFANYVKGQPLANNLGSKFFFKSATLTSTGKNHHLNVKMTSARVDGTECMTDAGLKNQNMALGSTPIMTKGNEYENIYPTWDWTRIPGTTSEYNLLPAINLNYWVQASKNKFGGGLAQGTTGIAAFVMNAGENDPDNGISFRKAYFVFDDVMVCLGNGISASKTNSVITSVNQCFSANNAIVFDGAEKKVTGIQTTTYNNNLKWAFHENVVYLFPNGGNVTLSNIDQSGAWYDINLLYGKNVLTNRVFSLWFDHGKAPNNATYEYIVVLGKDLTTFKTYVNNHGLVTLQNDATIQAVKNTLANSYGLVFHKAATINLGNGLVVKADKPCVMLIEKNSTGYKTTISDPFCTETQTTITTTFNNKQTPFVFPSGDYAGNSVTQQINLIITGNEETETDLSSQISFYPNPFTNTLQLQTKGAYTLYDLSGVMIEKGNCNGTCEIGNNLMPSIYFLEVQNEGKANRIKVIKQ